MKVILTAFNRKLKSDIVDWPEESPPDVNILLGMDTTRNVMMFEEKLPTNISKPVICRFVRSENPFEQSGKAAVEYILVEIKEC